MQVSLHREPHDAMLVEKLTGSLYWSWSSMCQPYIKAVATDFEVVRPGSGCGLFNVGVVHSM